MNALTHHPQFDRNMLDALQHQTIELVNFCPDNRLRQLLYYHLQDLGSQTRAKLAISSSLALSLPTNVCTSIATSCELLHNASLLIDDVQDQDIVRRGRPAAWVKFDTNAAICAGTYLISAAYASLAKVQPFSGELITHTHMRVANLISGQSQDLRHAEQPSDSHTYLQIAMQKSGSLLSLPLEISLIAAQKKEFVELAQKAGEQFAVAYQIFDDLNDLETDAAKGGCNLIHILENTTHDLEGATKQALEIAKHHLSGCLSTADQLPMQCGAYLQGLSRQLASKLASHNLPEGASL